MSKKDKPSKKQGKPRVHKDLKGFEITIDQFGEIKSNTNIEKINEFLSKNVDDKKLAERDKDMKGSKKKKKN
ncbi:MAG: hypothetical protein RIB47_14005 [Cyclobacteriaceae bacterium]